MQRILKASADLRFSAAVDIPAAVEQLVGASRECKSIVIRPALLAAMPSAALALAVARNLHLVTFPQPKHGSARLPYNV
ncbi:MAG: hypothetical protein CYG59_14515 [Chloroflexi bacterium]|nr:MAG: hypothetical protein CYG59_14515 [Chloroflexota bacterium]